MLYRETRPLIRTIGALLFLITAQLTIGEVSSAQTIVIPSMTVSETYDSNVFFAPKALLPPGAKVEDFSTTFTPQLNIAHSGPLIRGSMSVGGLITRYLENKDLNYTGINATGQLDLRQLAYKLSQRLTSLSFNGTYQFTPSIGAFGATGGAVGAGFGVVGAPTQISSGLLTNRVNMQMINLGTTGTYQLTRTTALTGSYNYSKISFGGQAGGVDNQLFGTQGHEGTTALTTQLNPRDTVGTTATLSHYQQEESEGSGQGSFTTVSGMGTWSHMWTQKLRSSIAGGAIVTLPIESAVPGQSIKAQAAPTATMSLMYTSVSEALRAAGSTPGPFDGLPNLIGSLNPGGVIPAGQFTASMSYDFSVFPSYAFGAGPVKAHVLGASVVGGITSKLTAQVGMNYSHGSSSSPPSTFDSVGVTGALSYLIGPVLASLTYNWMYFSNSSTDLAQNRSEYLFSKKMVILSLSTAFNSQSFFRMGGFAGFGNKGTTAPAEGGSTPASSGPGSIPGASGSGK